MAPLPQHQRQIGSIAVIGNYLPRRCGIATFTTDLVESLAVEAAGIRCWAVAMNDRPAGYPYPNRVRFEIDQNKLTDYSIAAEFLAINKIDVVCVQHEFGIFGGPAGSHLLKLLGELNMPVVTTLHTVLREPSPEYRKVMLRLADLSDRLIVMSLKAVGFLKEVYGVPEHKIAFVHHGIPDTPFIDPNFYKDQFGVEGKRVLLTFGLLSPAKGIEDVIRALPAILERHPDVAYIVLGATHPHVLQSDGEEYRIRLQQLVRKLGIRDHVIFQNRFVELQELCEFLGAADLYITPYLQEAQITSGTLAYAMGAGKAVISTPYWYATEMLADGRGIIVPFGDPTAIAQEVSAVLDDEVQRNTMRKKAYAFCRAATWKEVAGRYLQVFNEARQSRARRPRPRRVRADEIRTITPFELPEFRLDHLKTLTDDTGILQHAVHTVPRRDHGYCTDDNARALLVVAMAGKYPAGDGLNLDALTNCYLSFLQYAFHSETGRFRNFMTYARRWLEETGSEDSHGRALWSLGQAVVYLDHTGHTELSTTLFSDAIRVSEHFRSPRAVAFSLIGIHAYLEKFSGDSEVRRIRAALSERLYDAFKANAKPGWPWPEQSLNYANAKLPHALLLCGAYEESAEKIAMGMRSLEWLLEIQTEGGHFSPVGSSGWYQEGGARARFDQQPIEAHAAIEACAAAFTITGRRFWFDNAVLCFNWFLGLNDLSLPLYDPRTGGCRDGLMADGVNKNEGAESTLSYLLSHICLHELYASELIRTPTALPASRSG